MGVVIAQVRRVTFRGCLYLAVPKCWTIWLDKVRGGDGVVAVPTMMTW